MNLKALITSLVLGSSSVALAQPVSFGARAQVSANIGLGYNAGPVVRDHRTPALPPAPQTVSWHDRFHVQPAPAPVMVRPVYEPVYQPRWTELGALGNTDYNEQVLVGADKGYFRTIEVQPTAGKTFVTQVAIGFTDGTYQTVQPRRTLEPGCDAVKIDISGNRQIARILIAGQSYNGATYRIIGA